MYTIQEEKEMSARIAAEERLMQRQKSEILWHNLMSKWPVSKRYLTVNNDALDEACESMFKCSVSPCTKRKNAWLSNAWVVYKYDPEFLEDIKSAGAWLNKYDF